MRARINVGALSGMHLAIHSDARARGEPRVPHSDFTNPKGDKIEDRWRKVLGSHATTCLTMERPEGGGGEDSVGGLELGMHARFIPGRGLEQAT